MGARPFAMRSNLIEIKCAHPLTDLRSSQNGRGIRLESLEIIPNMSTDSPSRVGKGPEDGLPERDEPVPIFAPDDEKVCAVSQLT